VSENISRPFCCIEPTQAIRSGYCTLADTEAFAVSVKAQLFAFPPPLEQAPDQIASRPDATPKVIWVFVAKGADAVAPTVTLIPAGADVTCSPLRPVADTVRVTLVAAVVTLRVVARLTEL
jgi:hypothetical protein